MKHKLPPGGKPGIVIVPFVVHNLEQPDNMMHRRESMRAALDRMKGGAGVLNEIHGDDVGYLAAEAKKRGLRVYRYLSNALLWSPEVFKLDFRRAKRLMTGGYLGADGTPAGPDNRRLGPSRYMLQAGFTVLAIGFRWQLNGTHLMAKKDTTHKWRRPLWEDSVEVGGDLIADAMDTHPNFTSAGDLNSREYRDWPGVPDVVVKTPVTHGKSAHYDQVANGGRVRVSHVQRFRTRSDHWGVVLWLHFSHEFTPLKPALEPKKVKARPTSTKVRVNWLARGAPVKHPWAPRSARWKRRHPRLWRRIVAFRRRWRRTH